MEDREFADRHLQPYKIKGDEIIPTLCPYCKGGPHHDKYTFALNFIKGTYNCKRGSCGKSGHISELFRDFGEIYRMESNYELRPVKKNYKKPSINSIELNKAAIDYAAQRKISLSTLKYFNITQKENMYVFPFYDENNTFTFVKYRPVGKIAKGQRKAYRETDTKPILFNMNKIDITQPVVITEGEFDAMAVYESGYKNVVSVPSGAEDFTWITTCWDWLEKINKIILFGDNDEPGKDMINNIIVKLGEYRCYVAEHEYKDANEVLFRQGPKAVIKAIDEARGIPVAGIVNVADIDIIAARPKGIRMGFKTIDKLLNGARPGEVTIWTGKNGEGKSTILGQVILEAIEQNKNVFAYSGELTKRDFKEWLYSQAAGKENLKFVKNEYDSYDIEFEPGLIKKIDNWINGKLFLFDNSIKSQNIKNTSIIDMCGYAAKKYNCKVFVIDNLMTADFETYDEDYYRGQSKFVGSLVSFSLNFNAHVHLVAHPRKKIGELEKDDISGTGDITNRVHNVISIERTNYEKGAIYDGKLKVLKNRNKGQLGEADLIFSKQDRRLYEVDEKGLIIKKQYSWNNYDTDLIEIYSKCPWDEEGINEPK